MGTELCDLAWVAVTPTVVSSTLSFAARHDPLNHIEDPSLLRGVPLRKLLRSFGALLATPADGWQYKLSDEVASALYSTSREVSSLDWFISHSWQDCRWQKYAALSWTINRHGALLLANSAAALWALARFFGIALPKSNVKQTFLEDEDAAYATGYNLLIFTVVFIVTLFWNPRLLLSEIHDPVLFLDKACIHQTDAVRKAAGIQSLGGFLANSKRMIVLWSPGYFERLWCNYEIACFASLHGLEAVDFVPLCVPAIACTNLLLLLLSMLVLDCANLLKYISFDGMILYSIAYVVFVLLCFCYSRGMRCRTVLQRRLKDFTLADSNCYCCSVGHVLPGTASRIPCDRKFVETNIGNWFHEAVQERDKDGVEAFQRCVREILGGQIHRYVGPYCIPVSTFVPLYYATAWLVIDMALFTDGSNLRISLAFFVIHLITILTLCVPLVCLTTSFISQHSDSDLFARHPWLVDALSSLIVGFASVGGIFVSANVLAYSFRIGSSTCMLLFELCIFLVYCITQGLQT